MTPQQHVDYAQTVEKQLYKGYIAKGGLPPVFGEWALAGMVLPSDIQPKPGPTPRYTGHGNRVTRRCSMISSRTMQQDRGAGCLQLRVAHAELRLQVFRTAPRSMTWSTRSGASTMPRPPPISSPAALAGASPSTLRTRSAART